ncbi:hypothetical protein EJ08DRAFT_617771 [Tothia fuscella]|uniref:DUF6697 domain-containing protein n=1 Tax=Tothia fuscella TaxID=1048955 RepID=A0A9P4TV94_9PEZI|nr:hypothetical protein EJ08DRAFT_617771 [Tothia fuscella]
MQSIEDPARNAGEAWQPNYLRGLASLQDLKIPPPSKVVTFTGEFLQSTFGGIEWSPGLYFKPVSAGDCLLPTRTYYAINATCEPYLPTKSGTHGAKLVPFFNNVDTTDGDAAYENVPLFISAAKRGNNRFGDNEYIYFGTYSQTRWSDKLDYDRIREHVPDEVKFFWAEQLSDPGRPDWVTRCLMKHMIPQPEYEGVLPNSSAASDVTVDEKDLNKQMDKDVRRYIRELRAWEKDASLKAKLLKKENILVAFGNADADADPGLRLWWEYLECVGFDNGFYDMLVGLQAKQKR